MMDMQKELEEICVEVNREGDFSLIQKWDKDMEVIIDNINDAIYIRDLLDKFIVEQESK